MKSNIAIYLIEHRASGRQYVGSAVNYPSRISLHRMQLRKGIHHSRHLQRAWTKYGEEAFVFRKLILCEKKDLLMYEQRAIDALKPAFNMTPTAGSTLGLKHTDAQKEANSERCRTQRGTPEWKAAQSARVKQAWAEGKLKAENTRAYHASVSKEELSRKYTPEVRAKLVIKARARAVTYDVGGVALTLLEVAEKFGMSLYRLRGRLQLGWDIDKAITTPVDASKRVGGDKKYMAEGIKMSLTDVATRARVSPSTAHRWFAAGFSTEEILRGEARKRARKKWPG